MTALETRHEEQLSLASTGPWSVVVWDDPVNLQSYVSYVFRTHFGLDADTAHSRMLQVHNNGRATLASGMREAMERHVAAMHGYGLQASLEPAA